ncbi:serine hydrolase [candidate division KSB1 bacterium]|nr:serine hydrolase [candidate division KSB1 bacterium]
MKRNHLTPFFKIFLLIFFTCLISYNFVYSQEKAVKIDSLLQKYHEYRQFNGTALVAEAGKIIFQKGYGLANMEWNIANEPDTKFRLGSITKQFTSMLIMQLVEEGKIRLDEKMTTYLPDYRKDTGDRVTIHHLLTHTSGIPSYTSLPNFSKDISRNPYSVDEFVKQFCSDTLSFAPGSRFLYNNSGYFLLGAIIEKVTGEPYEVVLKKRILDPLGMKNTGYDHHATIIPKRATGYEKSSDGYINSAYLDMSIPHAAGSLYSTIADLYVWDQALYTDKLLSKKYREMMFKPFLNHYAYGWGVRKIQLDRSKDSTLVISHGGGINGFSTLISRLVDDKHLIVLFNNTGGTDLGRMSTGITNILYGRPYLLPEKSIAEELYNVIIKNNIATAIDRYHELKKNDPDNYNFRENELNRLGYQLLQNNKANEAIEIFKLNVEAYPGSANVYDSLGEAYMIDGQKVPAIKNYKKSLELNPDNPNAVKNLKILEKQ